MVSYSRRGNFGDSLVRCVLWLNDTKEVNRKCSLATNTTVHNFQPSARDPERHSAELKQTDRQHDANSRSHRVTERSAKIE